MRIATFNVNGVNGRLASILRWLDEDKPDIACLQELKAPQARFPAKAFRDAGYGAIWRGQSAWNGVAILTRGTEPIERRRALPGEPEDAASRYIEAEVGDLVIGCLYAPNGNPAPGPKFDAKLEWLARFLLHAEALLAEDRPVILAGDYNIIPTDLDVYVPDRWRDDGLFRPEVRTAYRYLLDQGWTDALRSLHPDETIYTFWDYLRRRFDRDAGLRIDHLLLDPRLAGRLVAAGVDKHVRAREKPSDHAPTWAELRD
jgi:exodeoxyribonuclease III